MKCFERRRRVAVWACAQAGAVSLLCAGNAPADKAGPPPAPPLPALESLRLEPESLVLKDGRDERRVLVWGETATGHRFDVTDLAEWKADGDLVKVGEDGYLLGQAKGETTVTVTAGGRQAKLAVKIEGAELPPVRFVRDVMPMLSRVGCNAGTCHGSAKGKNGFKLSLRGYDPEFDYQALINDLSGRRFDRVAVDESLMLLKPTAEVPHEGRQAIKPGSRYHKLLRQWIAEGVRSEDLEKGRANSIEVLPAEVNLDLPGRAQHVLVIAHYADGTARDVTREAVLSASNTEVLAVKEGRATALRRGEAAILVRYEGVYATRLVTVMGDRTGFVWEKQPEFNFIDRHVDAKLEKLRIRPSEICGDAEFMRRVSLDLTGVPPAPEAVRAFLADGTDCAVKREKLVDALVGSADYVEYWANKWADLLQCNSETLGEKGVWVFRQWLRDALARNTAYDQFVRSLLLAEGSSFKNPAVNYYRALREPGKIVEDVSQTFLGVRFNCAKCHDHPFEKWTQNQYYQFGAYFAQLGIKRGYLGREVVRSFTGDNYTTSAEEIVYRKPEGGEVQHPKTGMNAPPKVPFGEAGDAAAAADRRESFVRWLTSKENPLFAKALVNRVWSYFLGRGIIEPVDDIRASNPPSNPELLEALTEDFVRNGFDSRKLMRAICLSRTYQSSIHPNKWNEDDLVNFSHALPRRLSAEQIVDALAVATGHRPKFPGMPDGLRAVEIPNGMVEGNEFLTLFGRPKRQSACECERTSNVSLAHALNLINGNMIGEAVQAPGNRLAKLVESEKEDQKVVEDVYLACLARPPTEKEQALAKLSAAPSRLEGAQDLAWALLNSPAFLFNR
jgi:hypothetical protein